jgi:hypothetical protein
VIDPGLHVLAAALATMRLTDLVISDRLTAGLRARRDWYLLTCGRCVSVWAGLACTAVYLLWPWALWPFALSWVWVWRQEWSAYRRMRAQLAAMTAQVKELTARTQVSSPRGEQAWL